MVLHRLPLCFIRKLFMSPKPLCTNLRPKGWGFRPITLILLCLMLATYVANNTYERLYALAPEDSRRDTAKELLTLKVPGANTFCPEYRHQAGFTDRISFIHTSGKFCMTPRSLCGIESAARVNPNMTVYVYMNTEQTFEDPKKYGTGQHGKVLSCEVTKVLNLYPNIKIVHENLVDYLKDTKFWPLYETGAFAKSEWSLIHLSDALRLIILSKFGGFYLDFDTITFRPLHCLRNSASFLEDYPNIENGVMVFDKDNLFLKFLQKYMAKLYNPAVRMTLGPPAVGRAFMMFCSKDRLETGSYACYNNTPVNLVHPDSFYPIRHTIWPHSYTAKIAEEDIQRMENSYLAHIYGANWGYEVPPTSLYASLARHYCPNVWNMTQIQQVLYGF